MALNDLTGLVEFCSREFEKACSTIMHRLAESEYAASARSCRWFWV